MTRHSLRIPWAGPAVAAALLFAAFTSRPAHAAPVAAVNAVQVKAMVACAQEASDFVQAINNWLDAWDNYTNSLPGGTAGEIQEAADQLKQATDKVVATGLSFIFCILKFFN